MFLAFRVCGIFLIRNVVELIADCFNLTRSEEKFYFFRNLDYISAKLGQKKCGEMYSRCKKV